MPVHALLETLAETLSFAYIRFTPQGAKIEEGGEPHLLPPGETLAACAPFVAQKPDLLMMARRGRPVHMVVPSGTPPEHRWLEYTIRYVEEPRSWLLVVRDITERERLRERMTALQAEHQRIQDDIGEHRIALERARRDQEAQHRHKTLFLAALAHQLRWPLTILNGTIEMLLDGDFGPLTPEQSRPLHAAQQGLEQLNTLAARLLDLTRLEAERLHLLIAPVALEDVLTILHDLWHPRYAQKEQTFDIIHPPTLPTLYADARRLTQMLDELLDNAWRHTPAGTHITLHVEPTPDAQIRFVVRDTGPGIPDTMRAHIFNPFAQVAQKRSLLALHEGIHLGLYLTYRLAQLHGGTLDVQSSPTGTTCTLQLPLRSRRHAAVSTRQSA
ncbi:MAG: sensor histidine kinase [Ardenticatenia bacterium]|nr:MAG: sensor histidine kinase [Ardenticatenia bacterium]